MQNISDVAGILSAAHQAPGWAVQQAIDELSGGDVRLDEDEVIERAWQIVEGGES